MPSYETFVQCSVQDAAYSLEKSIPENIAGSEFIDKYFLYTPDGKSCAVMFFEKYYLRNANRTSLTLTVDDFNQGTHICATTLAGGGLFFNFDWGAGKKLLSTLVELLDAL